MSSTLWIGINVVMNKKFIGTKIFVDYAGVKFTVRQLMVMNELSKGLTNSQIAKKLSVTEKTIKYHMSGIYKSISVENRLQAMKWIYDRKATRKGTDSLHEIMRTNGLET